MPRLNRQRAGRLRIAVRYLVEHDELAIGSQSRLAEHFQVSRQLVNQIVVQERRNHAAKARGVEDADESNTTAA